MKALVLCAGYATRLYPLTLDRPKPLLPVGGKPLIAHITDRLAAVPEIDLIYIVTNEKFIGQFDSWRRDQRSRCKIRCLTDGTVSETDKLGAVCDLKFAIEQEHINDDLLVVAGDNLFGLDSNRLVDFYHAHGPSVAVCDVKDRELVKQYNEIRLDSGGRVVYFREKPTEPAATLTAICMYVFPPGIIGHIRQYSAEGNNLDQPGRFIEWLYKKIDLYGFVFIEPWFDIGDHKQYDRAQREFNG